MTRFAIPCNLVWSCVIPEAFVELYCYIPLSLAYVSLRHL